MKYKHHNRKQGMIMIMIMKIQPCMMKKSMKTNTTHIELLIQNRTTYPFQY